jgi:dienelactone hydrolase
MKSVLAGVFCAVSGVALAAPVVEKVAYDIDGAPFESVLVYDGDREGKRPGLLMVPNWLGINNTAIARAKELAGDDYVVLVADMYGTAVRPSNFDEAGEASGKVTADRALMRARSQRALQALKEAGASVLDGGRIVALGFCFGGTTALELARTGADIDGAVSFHGNPMPVQPAGEGEVKASILVLHGADDFFVPEENLRAFEKEMRDAKADWTLVSLSGARHCFAEKEADNRPPGCLYNERAAKRAYAMLDRFLDEQFATD